MTRARPTSRPTSRATGERRRVARGPAPGCALGERYLVIANSHVDEFDEHAGAPKPAAKLRPLAVLAVPLR